MTITGEVKQKISNYKAVNLRKQLVDLSYEDMLFKTHSDVDIQNVQIKNLEAKDSPVLTSFSYEFDDAVEEISGKIYINPIQFFYNEENPFKQDQRKYPIDIKYSSQNNFYISIEIPEGYKVESVPEKTQISLENNLGKFVYSSSVMGNTIKVNSFFDLNSNIIPYTQYAALKMLYNNCIEKHSEKIVLSKI